MEKIFISIPSYEDEILVQTLTECLGKAKHPERLTFGIALQYKQLPEPDISFLGDSATIVRYDVDTRPGLIEIRGHLGSLIKDEEYFLGIDSHTLFRQDWDEILINDHKFIQQATGNSKIAIGEIYDGFLPWLEMEVAPVNRYLNTNWKLEPRPLNPEFPFIDNYGEVWESVVTNANKSTDIVYKSIYFLSQNFWFTTSDFFKHGFFPIFHKVGGDEVEVSMALYVNGYDMYQPINKHILTAPKSETTNRENPIHWRAPNQKNWNVDDAAMTAEVLKLFILGENKYYSFNNRERTVDQFWRCIGKHAEHLTIKEQMLKLLLDA